MDKELRPEYIYLNGTRQYLWIWQDNRDNPVMLYVHGGPGIPELPLLHKYNRELTKQVTIVYWEQRGAGKSYSRNIPADSYTISQFVKDGHDLTRAMLKRFRKEKIFIMGHSWGTLPAILLAHANPELYHAYIGIGQMVNLKKSEEISYNYVMTKAGEKRNSKALKQLRAINTPPFLTIPGNNSWYSQLKTQRKWLARFGGIIHQKKMLRKFLKLYLLSSHYTPLDLLRIYRGNEVSVQKLWPAIMNTNLFDGLTEFNIPVCFFQGKYDYNCPTSLVQDYFQQVKAPLKELYIFENSAHAPNYEESSRFNKIAAQIVRSYLQPQFQKSEPAIFR